MRKQLTAVALVIFSASAGAYPYLDGTDKTCYVPHHAVHFWYATTLNPCDISLFRGSANNPNQRITSAIGRAFRKNLTVTSLPFTPPEFCETRVVSDGNRGCWVYDEKGGLHIGGTNWTTNVEICQSGTPNLYNATYTLDCKNVYPATAAQEACVDDVLSGVLPKTTVCN